MIETPNNQNGGQPQPQTGITVVPGNLAIPVPSMQLCAHITRENFHVLMEGSGTPREASIRDASIGVGATAITSAIALGLSTDLFRHVQSGTELLKVPNWGPLLVTIILGFAGVFALALAYLANIRAVGATGRRSYDKLIGRLRADLQIEQPGAA